MNLFTQQEMVWMIRVALAFAVLVICAFNAANHPRDPRSRGGW